MATKRRLNEIAAQFGDKKDISIFLGREKIFPGKEISDQTLERLENALRSPESEQGSLRVQEGKALIYQSAKGELKLDTRGVAPAFQSVLDQVQSMDAAEQEYEILMQDAPVAESQLERDEQFTEVALAQNITPEKYVNLLAHAPHTRDMMQQGTPVADITREYLAPKMRDYLIAQQERDNKPVSREPAGALMVAQSKQLIPFPVNAPQPELDRNMSEVLSSARANAAAAYEATINVYQEKLDRSPLSYTFDEIKSGAAKGYDKLFTDAALDQGMSKPEYEQVFSQSPYVLSQLESGATFETVSKDYIAPAVSSYDSQLQAQQSYVGGLRSYHESNPNAWETTGKSLPALTESAQYPHYARELDEKFTEGAQLQGMSKEQYEQAISHSPYVRMQLEGGATFEAVSKDYIAPSVLNYEQALAKESQDYQLLNPPEATNHASLEPVAADVNARIESLQAQLNETKAALQELSAQVKDSKLGTWATKQATEIGKTSQVIAVQTKSRVTQWMSSKVSEVKSLAHEKLNEGKTFAQGKVDEFKIAAQLKAIEAKEALREKVNELLAPVNAQKLEASARYVIEHYGDGKSYDKAATHAFRLNDNNELSISRQSDSKVVFEGGSLTKAADSRDVLNLNTLPDFVGKVKAVLAEPEQRQEAEMGA